MACGSGRSSVTKTSDFLSRTSEELETLGTVESSAKRTIDERESIFNTILCHVLLLVIALNSRPSKGS